MAFPSFRVQRLALLAILLLLAPANGEASLEAGATSVSASVFHLASPSVLRVPSEYGTIQEAIDSAKAHDVIVVGDGNYTENLEITKPLSIHSENGPSSTFVIAAQASQHVMKILANHTTVSGFTLLGASGTGRAGIYAYGVTNTSISGNRFMDNHDGISLDHVGNSTVEGNDAIGNSNRGIFVNVVAEGNCVTHIANNDAIDNGEAGISLNEQVSQGSMKVVDNLVSGNGIGVAYVCAKSRFEGDFGHDFMSNNVIANNSGVGLSVYAVNVRTIFEISGNEILSNGAGVLLEGVSTGGFNISENRIVHNSGTAFNGSWVNTGYNFTDRLVGAVFHGNAILRNDGVGIGLANIKTSGEICFTGNLLANNSGSGIMLAALKASEACELVNNTIEWNGGLGIEFVDLKIGGASSISNNVIRGNGGAPGFLELSYWEDLVSDWEMLVGRDLEPGDFRGLGGVAVVDCTPSALSFTNNTIHGNDGTGIMYGGNVVGDGDWEGNSIANNSGHGLLFLDTISVGDFSANQVLGNGLAGISMGSAVEDVFFGYDFTYNEIIGNRAGLVLNGTVGVTIAHNNISQNRDLGIYFQGGTGNQVHNCTIRGNMGDLAAYGGTKAGIYAWGEDVVRISHSDVSGNYNGIVVDRGTEIQICGNVVDDNLGLGMDVGAMFVGVYNISGNVVRGNGDAGIRLEQTSAKGSAVVKDNYLSGNRGGLVYESAKGSYTDGLVHRDVVSWNTVVQDSGPGMSLVFKHGEGYVTEVDYNNISYNAGGLLISDKSGCGSVVRHNSICDNSGPGVMGSWKNGVFQSTDYWVYDPEILEKRCGVPYDGNSDEFAVIFQYNTISRNDGPGLALLGLSNGGGVPIVNNTITYNIGTGILILGASDGGPNPILDNTVVGNTGAGIELYDATNGDASLVAGNTICSNRALLLLLDLSDMSVNQELLDGLTAGIDNIPEELIEDLVEDLVDGLEWMIDDLEEEFEYEELEALGVELGHQGGIFIMSDRSGGYAMMNNDIRNNGGDGVSTLVTKSGLGLIEGNTITNNAGTGVRTLISKAYSGSVSGNLIEGCGGHGVWVFCSSSGERVIAANTIRSNSLAGVFLGPGAVGYNVTGNGFSGNGQDIYLHSTARASILGNELSGGNLGVVLDGSVDCTISGNLIRDHEGPGIRIGSGSGNMVWNNSLLGNNGAGAIFDPGAVQAEDSGEGNYWNGSRASGGFGNYWSDWTSPDDDADGFVDLPYVLSGEAGSRDLRPLAAPAWILGIPPLPPAGLTSTGGILFVNLSWNPPPSQGEEAALRFLVYRGNSTHRSWLAEVLSQSTCYADLDVVPGSVYHYHVTAANSYGESGPSNVATAAALYPFTVPRLTIINPTNGSALNSDSVQVEWSGDGNGSPIQAYEARIDGGAWVNMALEVRRTFSGLPEGPHTAEVRVRNEGGGSRTVSSRFVLDRTLPTLTIAEPGNGTIANVTSVAISWEGQDAASGIMGYRTRLDGGSWLNRGLSGSLSLTGLAEGRHSLELEATDSAGNKVIQSVWFRVDTVAPAVLARTPGGGEVPPVSGITLTFSEEVEEVALFLRPGSVGWRLVCDGLTATFVLDNELTEPVAYEAEVVGRDRAGNALETCRWSFTIPEASVASLFVVLLFGVMRPRSRETAV